MKVFVYWNLHKKLFSVRDTKTGLVVQHRHALILKDAKFKVSEAGRKRVIREKRKNVHAGVEGYLLPATEIVLPQNCKSVGYNPYIYDSFVDFNGPVRSASKVFMFTSGFKPSMYYVAEKSQIPAKTA